MTGMADGTSRGRQAVRIWGIGLTALAFLAAGVAAHADETGPAARAVRLSYVQGQVQISQGQQAITSQAVANMPVFEGYQLTTGQDGQAEVQFEDGSVARLAPDSALTVKVLRGQGSSGQAEMVLNGGLGYFELQGGEQAGRIEVEFGNAAVTAGGFTVMRVDVDTPPGNLAVFSGNAHLVQGDAVTLDLHGNESVALNGQDPSQYNLAETIETNSWDQWNSDRDQAMQAEANTQTKATDNFVNNDNPAWNDLSSNGNWYDVPGSGYVWSPYMAAYSGWDPYGCGQWMWTPQFGYTWVSCYAWGFMPYSCGTWNFYSSFGWGWSPGMGGCNPWWGGGGYGYGFGGGGGYIGPNIGTAPSGYRPVIRPPLVLHPPKGQFPAPIAVDREPKHGFKGPTMRPVNGPVTIAGHQVEPLRPMPVKTGFVQPARGVAVAGGATGRATAVGGEPRMPVVTGRDPQRQGYGPPAGRGYEPARGAQPQPIYRAGPGSYSPPAAGRGYTPPRGYSPPAQRGEPSPSRGGFAGGVGARPSGGNYSGGGARPSGGSYSGGGGGSFHGAAPAGGGGAYHGGGGGSYSGGGGGGGGARGGGGFSGGGGGGGGFHGGGEGGGAVSGGASVGGGGGGGAHGGGGGGGGGHR